MAEFIVGGGYDDDGSGYPGYGRDYYSPSNSNGDIGFRPALYCNAES